MICKHTHGHSYMHTRTCTAPSQTLIASPAPRGGGFDGIEVAEGAKEADGVEDGFVDGCGGCDTGGGRGTGLGPWSGE